MILTLRPARPDDAAFVSHAVMAALHLVDFPDTMDCPHCYPCLEQAIAEEEILYSYRHTRIAEVDGQRAGCFITYDGALFAPLRDRTYAVLLRAFPPQQPHSPSSADAAETPTQTTSGDAPQSTAPADFDPTQCEPETQAGEYYLDSLAVVPRYRKFGVGRMLVVDALCHGRNLGFRHFSGLVAVDSPQLLRFYQSEGLQPVKEQNLFGTPYYRLELHR